MMQTAMEALSTYGNERPLLIAVTVLTSFDENELQLLAVPGSIQEQVKRLALLSKEAGLDGVVCSAHEVTMIKEACGQKFIAVTPGIRPEKCSKNDQVRTMTPKDAIIIGSDYLVIGRPITKAADPTSAIKEIQDSIGLN